MKRAWHQQIKRAPKLARTDTDGTVFDSKGELTRWKKLQLWQLSGEIRNLRRQVQYPLVIHDTMLEPRPILTSTGKTVHYTADFVYEKKATYQTNPELNPDLTYIKWEETVEDYKGFVGRVEELRIAVFEAIYNKKVTLTGPRKKAKRG